MAEGLSHLPELKEIGFTAGGHLLDVQRISRDPAEGAAVLSALTQPVISPAGTRTAAMPLTSPRVQALLPALCVFRLLPYGFTNRDLRNCLAPLLGLDAGDHGSAGSSATTCGGSASTGSSSASRPPSATRSPPAASARRYP